MLRPELLPSRPHWKNVFQSNPQGLPQPHDPETDIVAPLLPQNQMGSVKSLDPLLFWPI
jgi:hypothetical protein